MKFLIELRYFWDQVRDDYPRQGKEQKFSRRYRHLLGMEFATYTAGEVAEHLLHWHIDPEEYARVYFTMLARVGRNENNSLDDAKKIFLR